jgi:phage terminase large subunit-like protein
MANKNQPTLEDLFELALGELDGSIRKPNILAYGGKPYPEQERFHKSDKRGRFLSGGNRGGKTDAEVVESIWWATNTHPYLKRPESWGNGAIQIRFVVVDIAKGVEQIILPKLKRWMTSSMLIEGSWDKSWDAKNLILTFSNGSTMDFVTWGMDMMKLGGVPRHIIFFDEEPPQNIFNESMMRLIDYNGRWVIAATPTKGMGWTYDLLWEPALENPNGEIDTFQLSAEQNPYIEAEEDDMNFYMMGMDKEEREVREKGSFVARSGLVFPSFAQEIEKYVKPQFLPPKDWEWYMSIDHGWNNPTAILWHAVAPNGDIVTFAESYKSNTTVAEHAAIIHEREKAWGKECDVRTGDPALKQTSGITGTSVLQAYAEQGVYIAVEGVPRAVMIGIEKMQEYMRIQPNGTPTWTVTENCVNLIRELKKLRWATYSSDKQAYAMNKQEEIHKKDDHAADSLRYFMTLMPDLRPNEGRKLTPMEKIPTTIPYTELLAKMSADPNVHFIDNEAGDAPQWETHESTDDLYGGY